MIDVMSLAFGRVCGRIGLRVRDDRLASYVARTVIAMAQRGFRDAEGLDAAVMQQFEDESVIGWNSERFGDATQGEPSLTPAAG